MTSYGEDEIKDYINKTLSNSKKRRFKGFNRESDGETITKDGKIVVPRSEINEVLMAIYKNPKTGFVGRDKLFKRVEDKYLGINIRDVSKFLKANTVSQLHNPVRRKKTVMPIINSKPGAYIQIDLITGYAKLDTYNRGYQNILTAIDVNTRMAYAYPLKSKRKEEVVDRIKDVLEAVKSDAKRYPSVIQSDNGPEFKNELMTELCEELNIKQLFSMSYTPSSQGLVERFNGNLTRLIGIWFTQSGKKVWYDKLDDFVQNYNTRWHSSSKETPSKMMNDEKANRDGHNEIKRQGYKTMLKTRKDFPPIEKGQYVRVSLIWLNSAQRKLRLNNWRKSNATQNWSQKIYKVEAVHGKGWLNEKLGLRRDDKYTIRNTEDKDDLIRNVPRDALLKTASPDNIVNKPAIKGDVIIPIDLNDDTDERLKLKQQAMNEVVRNESIADRIKQRNKEPDTIAGRVRRRRNEKKNNIGFSNNR